MSAAEVFAIRGAKKYWVDVEDVEKYIKKKAAQKAKNGGKDWMDAMEEKKGAFGCVIQIHLSVLMSVLD